MPVSSPFFSTDLKNNLKHYYKTFWFNLLGEVDQSEEEA